MTTPTNNAVPSNNPSDLLFNSEKLDEVVSGTGQYYTDRLGVNRRTLVGIEASADAVLSGLGYLPPVAYASGISLTLSTQTVEYNGEVYAPKVSALPFTTTTWATDSAKLRLIQGVTAVDLAASGGASLVGYMPAGTGAVGTTVRAKLRESVSVKDFGASLNGTTDDSTALFNANAAAVAAKVQLLIPGVMHIGTPTTISAPIADGMHQMFSVTSQVTINNGMPVRPDWFGSSAGNIRLAVDSLPSTGGTVLLADKVYPPSYDTALPAYFNNRGGTPGVDYMIKPYVRIQGTRLPKYNITESALEKGSIIQGAFYVASEAQGFQADLIGVDSGIDVRNNVYGGVDHDCFCILQANKAAPVYGKDIHIGSVIGLCSGLTTQAHAVLLEAIDGGSVQYAEGRQSNHGVVIKSKNFSAGMLVGRRNHADDVYIKSDNYANMERVTVDQVVSEGRTTKLGCGLIVEAATASAGEVNIGTVTTDSHDIGLKVWADVGVILGDVNIGTLISRTHNIGYSINGDVRKAVVGSAIINATTSAVVCTATRIDNSIVSLSMEVATYGADISGKMRFGDVNAFGVTWVFYHRTNAARIFVDGATTGQSNTNFWAATPSLINGWVNVGGVNPAFSAELLGGEVTLRGLIKPGSGAQIATIPVTIRPAQPVRFTCLGFNGSTYSTIEILVTPAGELYASNYTAGSTYISIEGVRWAIPL